MSETTTTTLVFSTIAVIVMAIVFMRKLVMSKKGSPNFPPGYNGWPLIGEFFAFRKPFPSYTRGDYMEQRIKKFGKIFSTSLLGTKVVISADTELTRYILTNAMKYFESEWPGEFKKLIGPGSILVTKNKEAHRPLRNSVLNFFNMERIESQFLPDANEIVTQLMSSWKPGDVISAVGAVEDYTQDITFKNILGMQFEATETKQFRHDYYVFREGLLFALPINLPGTMLNKSLKARERVQKVIRRIYEERRQIEGCRGRRGDDYIGCIMRSTDLPKQQICDMMQEALFASEETTSIAICLIMYFLERSPKSMEHLKEEHEKVRMQKDEGGWSMLSWEGYKKLEFTHCVINESLRLGNMNRFFLKKTLIDLSFKGYDIPKGTLIVASFAAPHLDPSCFEDPGTFDPWRWKTSSGVTRSNNFYSFSGGPRLCPGAELARLKIGVFLHHLVLNFKYESVSDDEPIAFPTFTKFCKGFPIKVTPLS